MRICQLSHVETTFNFLVPLFGALTEDGHEVVAASNMDQGGAVLAHHLGTGYDFHRVRVSRKITVQAFSTEVVRLARYLARERFDVVHLHGPLASIQGRLAARLASVPCVVNHAHGFYFHEGMRPAARTVHVTAERLLTRHLTDHLVTVNAEDREFARLHGFTGDPDRIVGTPGVGIDIDAFAPGATDGPAIRRSLGIPDDELVVTFVGRLVSEKGVLELVSAFSRLLRDRPAWLLLVGDVSPTERDQSVLDRIDRLQQADPQAAARTLRLGQRRDVPAVLAATDLVVQPSYREGMPVALLEAMACGVPVVTTDIRGCREAVDGGRAGILVPPRDTGRLADAVCGLAADPDERARLSEVGRKRVEAHYATDVAVAPLIALYRRIEASQGAARGPRARLRTVARRVVPAAVRGSAARLPRWRILLQHVADPLAAVPDRTHCVLSEETLANHGIAMVADPFATHRDGVWHLFFEQVRTGSTRGEIGLATSPDLVDWTYQGVVLREDFHLSYPHLVETDEGMFMIPESSADGSVRLYRAARFPYGWELDRVLLDGAPYKDSTVLWHDGAYYLFTETSAGHTHDRLDLFLAPELRGPWTAHPAAPVVLGDPGAARPAGGVVGAGGRPVRLAQACEQVYGGGVRGRRILRLTPDEYREAPDGPEVLTKGSTPTGYGHHVDAHPVDGGWIRFVDAHD